MCPSGFKSNAGQSVFVPTSPLQEHKKMAREQTHTLVVNAHGALISLDLPVWVGQVVTLQNPETSEEQTCRIIRVNPKREGKAEVGVEFLKPAPNFWRVAFPPSDWIPHAPEITGDTF
jgi:hypothetical protein